MPDLPKKPKLGDLYQVTPKLFAGRRRAPEVDYFFSTWSNTGYFVELTLGSSLLVVDVYHYGITYAVCLHNGRLLAMGYGVLFRYC